MWDRWSDKVSYGWRWSMLVIQAWWRSVVSSGSRRMLVTSGARSGTSAPASASSSSAGTSNLRPPTSRRPGPKTPRASSTRAVGSPLDSTRTCREVMTTVTTWERGSGSPSTATSSDIPVSPTRGRIGRRAGAKHRRPDPLARPDGGGAHLIFVLGLVSVVGVAALTGAHRLLREVERNTSRLDDERSSPAWCHADLKTLASASGTACILPRYDHGAPAGTRRVDELFCAILDEAAASASGGDACASL